MFYYQKVGMRPAEQDQQWHCLNSHNGETPKGQDKVCMGYFESYDAGPCVKLKLTNAD